MARFVRLRRFFRPAIPAVAALLSGLALLAAPHDVKSRDRLAYALTGARVIAGPGRVFDPGVVIVRGGVIQAAGPESQVAISPHARVFDLKGKTLYAAFIDPYVSADRLSGVSGFEFRVRAPNSKL